MYGIPIQENCFRALSLVCRITLNLSLIIRFDNNLLLVELTGNLSILLLLARMVHSWPVVLWINQYAFGQ